MKKYLPIINTLIILTAFPVILAAQAPKATADTNTLYLFLKRGMFEGQVRTFFMSTLNEKKLSDYYALAAGAGISYHTPEWKGLSAGLSGFVIFNLVSSDLNKPDPLSQQKDRYEIGLFDITDPLNKYNLSRMEELYLKYQFKAVQATVGRQFIKTPFINKQDGRMRPTVVEGLYFQSKKTNKWIIDAGWLTGTAPRTTVGWYGIGESIGIYPPGVNTLGIKSGYPGNTKSNGIGIAGIQFKNKLLHLQLWNTYVKNVMNTILAQPEINFAFDEKNKILAGIQYVYQHSSGNGGNVDPLKRYYEKGNYTFAAGARLQYENTWWKTNLNYLHIDDHARFLMPREWGIEPFYTFMPRERNEGLGGVDAWTVNNYFALKNDRWKLTASYGKYYLPRTTDFRLNKYGLPSYQQINFSGSYNCKGFFENMSLQILIAWKGKVGKDTVELKNIINRVNMVNSSLIINYSF